MRQPPRELALRVVDELRSRYSEWVGVQAQLDEDWEDWEGADQYQFITQTEYGELLNVVPRDLAREVWTEMEER